MADNHLKIDRAFKRIRGQIVAARDMKTGDVGVVLKPEDSDRWWPTGHLLLRTYDSWVSLTNPEHTWTRHETDYAPTFRVKLVSAKVVPTPGSTSRRVQMKGEPLPDPTRRIIEV